MSPSRRVLPHALMLLTLAASLFAAPASAQFYDPTLRAAGLDDTFADSPRLLGMGGLGLAVADRDRQISLWDMAGNPLGVAWDDTTSTLKLSPRTGAVSGKHDLTGTRIRQYLAGRSVSLPFETFHRDDKGRAFGIVGQMRSVRTDSPWSDDVEARRSVGEPDVTAIANGPFQYLLKDKLRYAIRLRFASQHLRDEYRLFVSNPTGEYIAQDGMVLPSPNYFVPDEYKVSTRSLGAGLSYPLGKNHTLAVMADAQHQKLHGLNEAGRYSAETTEERPTKSGQASLFGRFGQNIEYGIDGRGYDSSSPQDWRFSLSAGVGAIPLVGRGRLLEREDKGSSLDSRVRWTSGKVALTGQVWTAANKMQVKAPHPNDFSSFNHFLSSIWYRVGVDTLFLPDSVRSDEYRRYAWGYGAGMSYKFHRGIAGAEWNWARDLTEDDLLGEGPKSVAYSVRAGVEYVCTPIVTGRLGYAVRWLDGDDLTQANEMVGQSFSLGLALKPVATSWSFEAGYAFGVLGSDYDDPVNHRQTQQQLVSRLRWDF